MIHTCYYIANMCFSNCVIVKLLLGQSSNFNVLNEIQEKGSDLFLLQNLCCLYFVCYAAVCRSKFLVKKSL